MNEHFDIPDNFWEIIPKRKSSGGYNPLNTLQDYIQKIEEKYPEEEQEHKKYNHYFKNVSNLEYIDIYRVLDLWSVTHPCLQHAAKKILVAGNRGHKDIAKDIQEAIDSLERWKQMQVENKGFNDEQEEDGE